MHRNVYPAIAILCFLVLVMVVVHKPSLSAGMFPQKGHQTQNLDMKMAEFHNRLEEKAESLKSINRITSTEQLFKDMKKYAESQVAGRRKMIEHVNHFLNLYGALAPEVFCPEKVRVGAIGDGGKWVCNPWKVPQDSVLFSLGLNNAIDFERNWQALVSNRSRLFGFDSAEQNEYTKAEYSRLRGVTRKVIISENTSNSSTSTISDLAKDANITQIEILKIDIEGAEKTCLIPFLEKYTVCQIYLEVHAIAGDMAKLLRNIAKLKYRLFSYEVNGNGMMFCEFSFIHESCVDKYEALRVANYLDF